LYVVDRGLGPVPPGVPGELCLGGDGLAWGYLNRPDLTAERFVPDPFSDSGGRLYRTGDLVRRRAADGAVEFLGRTDFQVKMRGFRIEPGEIEAALLAHPRVRDAAVLVLGEGGEKRLVAYLVTSPPVPLSHLPTDPRRERGDLAGAELPGPQEEASEAFPLSRGRVDGRWERGLGGEVRQFLAERLPAFMIPASWVFLDSLPLNPNGKVDRNALARIEPQAEEQAGFEPPRTATEELLAGAWAEVLGVERVGARDDFFDLGGHSLLATRLVSRVRGLFQVELPLRALFETSVLSGLAERIDRLRQDGEGLQPPPILRAGEAEGPLSFAQERLWFLERLDPGTPFYNVPFALRIVGGLDAGRMAAAFAEIVQRHEALRTTFGQRDGRPWQRVAPPADLPVPEIDLAGLPLERREAEAARRLREEAFRPFDLERGPLLRVLLVRLGAEERWAFLNVHHLVSDGWSIGVLVRELGTLYGGGELPRLPIQYLDFAAWQRAWLEGEVLQEHIRYWRERLRGARTVLDLPADRPRPPVQTFRGALRPVRPLELPGALVRDLATLGRRHGATLFMTLLAAWQTVLYRYTGQDDLLVGSPVAGRGRRELEGLIGLFVNTVVLRGELHGDPTFAGLLARIRADALGAFAHQDLPFERLVDELRVERSLARHPVFQVVFALNNTPWEGLVLPGLALEPLTVESGTTKVDLLLALAEGPDGLSGGWEYSTDLFDASTVERMTGHLRTVLEGAAADPSRLLSDLPLLAEPERHQILREWNDTLEVTQPAESLRLDQLFAAAAARFPEREAVVFEDQRLTYADLAARAESLADHLRSLGVGPEERVAICADESVERIVAVLAVFQAGGAYLPLDPSHPRDRLAWMLEDSRVRVLLVQESLVGVLPESEAVVLNLGLGGGALSCAAGEGRGGVFSPDHLAYLIYTSGSTGRPNGVPVPHRSACHLIRQAVRHFQVDETARVLQSVSFSFDASVLETWLALSTGAALVLCRRETRMSGRALADLIRGERITHAVLTPSVLGTLPEDGLPTLRTASVGGDSCPAELATRWSPPHRAMRLLNCYGPTETTIYALLEECRGPFRREPPIGRPVGNTRAHVLDPSGRLVPSGVPGELWLGGEGLARGYLNRPRLTAERFRPDPFAREGGARLYRTGDLVRLLGNGEIEFLGRVDRQVKVRGLRIELGEIEAALGRHPAVAECAVLALGQGADRKLAAFVVARPEGEGALLPQLREHLRLTLPDYMVPATFLFLETMPLTPVGKVDRRVLTGMEIVPGDGAGRIEARDILEMELARIWEEVLGRPRIGIRDNFFDAGGHSLLAVRLLARVQERFGRDLPLAVLFQDGTVEQMAALLRDGADGDHREASCLVPIQSGGSGTAFFCVHPAGGDVLCYATLARHLGRPFYGLQSPGLSVGEPVSDLPALAGLYLEEIRRIQPEGPWRIGGWSLGGVVAFEMVRQLRERGEEAVLVLIDTAPEMPAGESADDVDLLLDVVAYVANLWGKDLSLSRNDLEPLDPEARLDRVLGLLRGADFLPPGAGLDQLRRTLAVYRANLAAVRTYQPQPCGCGAVLFRAAETAETPEGDLGWSRLLNGPLELETVPGHHLNLLAEPNVQILAERLRHCLNEADLEEAAVRTPGRNR
ncbi:MAG TPA: amino acid adenylation domain-containing protein, partial [Thermoanaerobaculia bacterium]|nr:amino acid adenylation domain-containing protein [Thermoanaerobaculia bacterium]